MRNIVLFALCLNLIACSETEPEQKTGDEFSYQQETPSSPNQTGPANFVLKGSIPGGVNQPLMLEAVGAQGSLELAQGTVGADGNFQLKGNVKGLGLYQLRLGMVEGKVIPLTIEPGDTILLQVSYADFERLPVISGTKWAEPLTMYMSKFNEMAKKQVELAEAAKSKDMTQEQQIAAFLKIRKPLDAFAKEHMLKDPSNPVNIVLSTSLTPSMGFEYWDPSYLDVFQKVGKAYSESYKGSPIAASMSAQAEQIKTSFEDYKETKSGNKVAPEISLKNPQGKTIKLSSLRGKVVLIDFWASWCGPCRRENPNVVKMYNKYKSKGFEIFSVSLDSDAAAWKRAIEADGLIWPNHGSDLLQWNTPLKDVYGFNSIPYTVLVDKTGKIIATNLRGESLEQKLKEVL